METGLYEQLITKMIEARLDALDQGKYHIKRTVLDKAEAARFLASYLMEIMQKALGSFGGEPNLEKQVVLTNKIISFIRDELKDKDFEEDMVSTEAKILSAIFPILDASFSDFDLYLKEITPSTRLRQSELFTNNASGVSLQAELKKEIMSANAIYFLVSFIKWSGIVIFQQELKNFTDSGKRLKIITTSYIGATDFKAIEFLAGILSHSFLISLPSLTLNAMPKKYGVTGEPQKLIPSICIEEFCK